ncbi:MAG: zincin-like metallopeptidase domain-containing protein [Candidatus Contendobacter sp.]
MATSTHRGRGSHPDLYQEVTDRIVAMIEAGAAPWRKPWTTPRLPGVPALPVNAATGQPYHGVNVLLLLPLSMLFGDPRWCSYRQAEARGWQVRGGERGTPICFYKLLEIAPEDRDELRAILGDPDEAVRTVPLLRRSTVFHASQIDGLPTLEEAYGTGEPLPEAVWDAEAHLETLLARSGAMIEHRGFRAYYQPGEDRIVLPPRGRFPSAEAYYGTAFHELGHWTGHERRLNRPFSFDRGGSDYAREELRAELASAFLNAELGCQHDLDEHAAYLAMYLELLRQDKKEIFRAAKDAQAIADLILDRHPRLRLVQGVAVPRTGSPEPDGLAPDPTDFPTPIRTFDDLLIVHQRLIGGALREVVRRGEDEGYLGRLVRELEAALPQGSAVATAPLEQTSLGLSRRHDRVHVPVPGGR